MRLKYIHIFKYIVVEFPKVSSVGPVKGHVSQDRGSINGRHARVSLSTEAIWIQQQWKQKERDKTKWVEINNVETNGRGKEQEERSLEKKALLAAARKSKRMARPSVNGFWHYLNQNLSEKQRNSLHTSTSSSSPNSDQWRGDDNDRYYPNLRNDNWGGRRRGCGDQQIKEGMGLLPLPLIYVQSEIS